MNNAEGSSDFHKKDKIRYFRIARGSVFECIPAIKISRKQGFIDRGTHSKIYNECFEIPGMIAGLIRSVDERKKGKWDTGDNEND